MMMLHMPGWTLQDYRKTLEVLHIDLGEKCEVSKTEVPLPNFITQGVSLRRDVV
jgi:hypothetical protein